MALTERQRQKNERARAREFKRGCKRKRSRWRKGLQPHQRRTLEMADKGELPKTLWLWWQMGSGKSLGAMLCTVNEDIKRVLIVCPLTIKDQWAEDTATFAELCLRLKGGIRQKKRAHFTIVHYEGLRRMFPSGTITGYDMCIVDEAHRYRNVMHDAKAPDTFRDELHVALSCDRLVYLSGTPFWNNVAVEMESLNKMMRVSAEHPLNGRILYFEPENTRATYAEKVYVPKEEVSCPMSMEQFLKYTSSRSADWNGMLSTSRGFALRYRPRRSKAATAKSVGLATNWHTSLAA